MSHRLRAGFLFQSLLSFKEKKNKTLYLLHSPLRTFNVPINDVIVLKKSPPTAWNGSKLLLFFAMFWY